MKINRLTALMIWMWIVKGNIYFTDPPYGQPGTKTAEIGINGVFKVAPNGKVTMLIDSLNRPNGIALSLDQKKLYVNQSDKEKPFLYSYEIAADGTLINGDILFDFRPLAKHSKGLPDGLKIHKSGNIFATGPRRCTSHKSSGETPSHH
jgi:gluconolactonase